MSLILTTDKLIKSIKRRSFIPNDQVTFSEEEFLDIATEEITIGLMEKIISVRGDYLVYYLDVPIVDGVRKYSIPSRAHGNKLREATINDASDPTNIVYELYQTTIDDIIDIDQRFPNNNKSVFYLENNKLVLSDDVATSGSYVLRMYFYMRPSKLVPMSRGAAIQSISDGTEVIDGDNVPVKILSFSSLPKNFSTSINYDIVSNESPNKILNFDLTPVSINSTLKTITFIASDLPEDISVGNYVTQAEESIVPNIPTEFHPIVAQRTARACMEYLNDDAGYAKATAKLMEMEDQVIKIVRQRVEGAPKKIKNRKGTLRNGLNKTYSGKW